MAKTNGEQTDANLGKEVKIRPEKERQVCLRSGSLIRRRKKKILLSKNKRKKQINKKNRGSGGSGKRKSRVEGHKYHFLTQSLYSSQSALAC